MLHMWQEGQVVMYDWIQFLEYEVLSALGITDNTLDLSWAFPTTENTQSDLLCLFEKSYICCINFYTIH